MWVHRMSVGLVREPLGEPRRFGAGAEQIHVVVKSDPLVRRMSLVGLDEERPISSNAYSNCQAALAPPKFMKFDDRRFSWPPAPPSRNWRTLPRCCSGDGR